MIYKNGGDDIVAIIFSMLAGLALAAVILYVWINHVIVFTQAFGPSMTPAVWDGDYAGAGQQMAQIPRGRAVCVLPAVLQIRRGDGIKTVNKNHAGRQAIFRGRQQK